MIEKLSRFSRIVALRLLLIITASIFIAELFIMLALAPYLQSHPMLASAVDPVILTLTLFPVLYFIVFKKLARESDALAAARDEIHAAYDKLGSTVERRTREIEQTKRDLEESLQRFTDIAETAGDWIWEMDENLRLSFMTPRFFEIFPIARKDLIGKTREEFAGVKEYDENWRRHLDDLANRRPFRNFTYSTAQSDGRPQHIQISGKPIFDADGVFKGYRGTGTDKTAEIEARVALEESEKQFRNLIEGSIQGVFVHEDWNILFANQAMADIFGYEGPEEILALKKVEPLIAPDERERLMGYRTERRKGEDAPEIYEARGLDKGGSEIWLEFRVRNVDWHGIAAMQCVIIDISERKAAEKALNEKNKTFRQIVAALEQVHDMIVLFDPDDRIVFANQAWRQLNSGAEWATRPGLTFEQHLRGLLDGGFIPEAIGREEKWLSERLERHRNPRGRIDVQRQNNRWISVDEQVLDDGSSILVIQDITELKEAEKVLYDQKEQLRQILANVPRAIITVDENGIMKSFNPAAETTFGYSAKEAIGQNVSILMPQGEKKAHDGYIRAYLQSGAKKFLGQGPRRLKGGRKGDKEFPMELAIGEVCHDLKSKLFVAVAKDVTDDIRIEVTLKQQNEQLRKRDAELNEQNERFNAALENMSHGLCMFDREQRLVVCNDRYALIYGLSPKLIKPGMTLAQILQHRISSGIYSGDTPEEYIRERWTVVMERQSRTDFQELTDGRTVVIRHHPLADGGWLATHEDISDYRRIENRLAYLAHHDELTGLANRALLRERLDEQMERCRQGANFALLYLDLDGFKGINDTLGHSAGDQLLKAVGERLQNCIRETDLVARFGGDEFAILQASVEQPTDATELAKRINTAINAPFTLGQIEINIGVTIGIALAPKDGSDGEHLLSNADVALYHAKGVCRGTYCLFEPELETGTKNRHALGSDLRGALTRGEFELYYQPLFNLKEGKVSGFEALLRWHHPERGAVSPNEFIPIAEETGHISEIGGWALKQACTEATRWPDEIKVAVNVSPIQFRRGNLVQLVRDTLAATKLSANRLELEITESVLLRETNETLATLHELKEIGVRISMDDFGTGYSSLSYLRSFPFDKIKIDATFVRGHADIGIIQAVVGLASRLGVETTAEGIETEEQLEIVRAEGCTEAQGHLFALPRPAKDIEHLLPRRRKKVVSAA